MGTAALPIQSPCNSSCSSTSGSSSSTNTLCPRRRSSCATCQQQQQSGHYMAGGAARQARAYRGGDGGHYARGSFPIRCTIPCPSSRLYGQNWVTAHDTVPGPHMLPLFKGGWYVGLSWPGLAASLADAAKWLEHAGLVWLGGLGVGFRATP